MRISRLSVLSLIAVFAAVAHAASPTDGHVAGQSYVNSYFHITYTWPSMLKPVGLPPGANNSDGKSYMFPLFSAKQGDQPYGIVMVAEKLNVAGPHSQGIKSSADYVDHLAHSLLPGPILSNIARSQKKGPRGQVFEELSYLQSGKPALVLATQFGDYILIFKCNAQSTWDIAQMENSALALRTGK